jgi:hypothetical protein
LHNRLAGFLHCCPFPDLIDLGNQAFEPGGSIVSDSIEYFRGGGDIHLN